MAEANQTVNAVIAEALKNAGVSEQNIELPSEAVTEQANAPSLDGLPKGQVKGELPGAEEAEIPGAKPKEPSESKPDEPKVQPFGKAEIEAAIKEASSKFQGIMDRKINQLQYQMQQTVGALNQFFQSQEDSNLSGLPAEEQTQKRLDRLEKGTGAKIQIDTRQPVEQQAAQFYQQLVSFIDAVGLKIDDKRIDWAPDVSDPQAGFNRFLVSIRAALVADQTKAIQELKDNGAKVIAGVRKKAGIDKVSTTGPGGEGFPDFDKMTPMQKIEYGYAQQAQLSQVAE